jgi:hypothetical protein
MDLDKLNNSLAAMDSALSALEKATELRAQTGRFRNMLTTNDLDNVAAICVVSIKKLSAELTEALKSDG